MKKEVTVVLLVGFALMMSSSIMAFSFIDCVYSKSVVKTVYDFITGKGIGGPGCVEGYVKECTTQGEGICSSGTQTCDSDGNWGSCVQNEPTSEDCNDGLDNDCDGKTDQFDEDCWTCDPNANPPESNTCTTSLPGICSEGTQTCDTGVPGGGGTWGNCDPNVNPGDQLEVCDDGLDNDCDGYVDLLDLEDCGQQPDNCLEGTTEDCTISGEFGICSSGTRTCDAYGNWGSCVQDNEPISEICDDELDNDCNGVVNNGCEEEEEEVCNEGDAVNCLTGEEGLCNSGQKICQSDGSWGICERSLEPDEEICGDGLDNDCDGSIDSIDNDCGWLIIVGNEEETPETYFPGPGACILKSLVWENFESDITGTLGLVTEGDCTLTQFKMEIYERDLFVHDRIRDQSWFNDQGYPRVTITLNEDLEGIAGGFMELKNFEIIARVKVADSEEKAIRSEAWKIPRG